jgi:regulator of sigma E protease
VSWLLAFVGFALLVVLHELGHFTVAKWVGMRVEKFSLFFPPTLASKKIGETEYAIGLIPAGGYVRISGMNPSEDLPDDVRTRAYHAQPVWKRMAVIAAGPAVNLIVALVLFVVFFWLIGARTDPVTPQVDKIEQGFPAAEVLKPGDTVIAVDGVRGRPETLSKQISSHECPGGAKTEGCSAATPAKLTLERNGKRIVREVAPIYDDYPEVDRTRLGFSYLPGPRQTLPFGESVTISLDRFWLITQEMVKLPARIFDAEERKKINGIVGSYETTRKRIIDDIADAVGILAIISLSLAIINLFPFLPLDGGHIFWAAVEKLRGGKPVPLSVMERAGMVGFMLVIGLFAIGLTNDIGRLSDGGFR